MLKNLLIIITFMMVLSTNVYSQEHSDNPYGYSGYGEERGASECPVGTVPDGAGDCRRPVSNPSNSDGDGFNNFN